MEEAYEIGLNCVRERESGLMGVVDESDVCRYESCGSDRLDMVNRARGSDHWSSNDTCVLHKGSRAVLNSQLLAKPQAVRALGCTMGKKQGWVDRVAGSTCCSCS